MNKILNSLNRKIFNKQRVFVGYFLMGYPSKDDFLHLIESLNNSDIDVLELGIPSTDPISDGEVIRQAHDMVRRHSIIIDDYRMLRNLWHGPIWAMGYPNDLIATGLYRDLMRERLIDGLVVSGLTDEENRLIADEAATYSVDALTFLNPEMSETQMRDALQGYGIAYAQLYKGTTGENREMSNIDLMVRQAEIADIKICAGFGINTKEKMDKLFSLGFDGCIVGTELVRLYNEDPEKMLAFVNAKT